MLRNIILDKSDRLLVGRLFKNTDNKPRPIPKVYLIAHCCINLCNCANSGLNEEGF